MQLQTKCNNKIFIDGSHPLMTLNGLSCAPSNLRQDSLTNQAQQCRMKCHSQAPDVACRMFCFPLWARFHCIVHAFIFFSALESIRKGYNCMKISGNKLLKSTIKSVNFMWELWNRIIRQTETCERCFVQKFRAIMREKLQASSNISVLINRFTVPSEGGRKAKVK